MKDTFRNTFTVEKSRENLISSGRDLQSLKPQRYVYYIYNLKQNQSFLWIFLSGLDTRNSVAVSGLCSTSLQDTRLDEYPAKSTTQNSYTKAKIARGDLFANMR